MNYNGFVPQFINNITTPEEMYRLMPEPNKQERLNAVGGGSGVTTHY